MIVVWILLGLIGLILLLLLIALIRTLLMPSKRSTYTPAPDEKEALRLAEKLSRMVQVETVSAPGEDQREKFLAFHRELEALFPQHAVYHRVGGPTPDQTVPAAAPVVVVQAQMQQLLGDVEALDLFRAIGHQAAVVQHAAAVIVRRGVTGGVFQLQAGNPAGPLGKALLQVRAELLRVQHGGTSFSEPRPSSDGAGCVRCRVSV
jgi:hypothetical protein